MSAMAGGPIIKNVVVAEVKCYLCGSVSGEIEHDEGANGRTVVFRRPGDPRDLVLTNWRALRCQRCGGPVFLDEADIVTRRVETYNWLEERPRRGRPPKRLVEERRRQEEAARQAA